MRAWRFYDVKFNGTRLMLAREDNPATGAFLHDYLDGCDLVAMPRLPIPKRTAPHAGFWCTLAMKHLVGIRTGALRPDRLWRDSIAAGGKPYEPSSVMSAATTLQKSAPPSDAVLTFLKDHAYASNNSTNQQSWLEEAALSRQRSELVKKLRTRIRALRDKAATGRRARRSEEHTSE